MPKYGAPFRSTMNFSGLYVRQCVLIFRIIRSTGWILVAARAACLKRRQKKYLSALLPLPTVRPKCSRPPADVFRKHLCRRNFFVCRAEKIGKTGKYDVVSSVLVNHYLNGCARRNAYQSAWQALRPGGIYIFFENYDPETEKEYLLRRDEWIGFQRANGRTAEECSAHLARRFRAYFPYKLSALVPLLREVGFKKITVLHTSCLQAGVLAQKPFLSTSSGNRPSADN